MTKNIKITPTRSIGPTEPVFIIAEIGQNHNGCMDTAKKLIQEAKLAGADCVKFQKSNLKAKFTSTSLNRAYDSPHSFGITYEAHKKHLEFSIEQHRELQKYANDLDIIYSASAMDQVSYLELRDRLEPPFIKIGSGDSNNFFMFEKIVQEKFPPLIISTGMQSSAGIRRIMSIFKGKRDQIALLHCVSSYPTRPDDCRLRFIQKFKSEFSETIIGYSGHESVPILITLGAVALGAKVIERHVTLDKEQKGNDHSCSLTPDELRELCRLIRKVEKIQFEDLSTDGVCTGLYNFLKYEANFGIETEDLDSLRRALAPVNQDRNIFDCELPCYEKLGKTLVYSKNLNQGEIVTKTDLAIKVNTIKGVSPEDVVQIIDKKLLEKVELDDPVQITDFM